MEPSVPLVMTVKQSLFGTPARRDQLAIGLWCLISWQIFEQFDVFETIYETTRELEHLELDELITLLLSLPALLLFYVLRRNKEMQHEVAQRRIAEEAVRRLAHFDALTGLANRGLFDDRLAQGVARARRQNTQLAVLFIDLDGFKGVNDQYGHAAGDQTLRQVAERVRHRIRNHDTAARLGGDEFVVLLDPVDSASEAEQVAGRLIESIRRTIVLPCGEVEVSASIGISLFSGIGQEDDEPLMRQADLAMYEAKAQGKNRFRRYSPPMPGASVVEQSIR